MTVSIDIDLNARPAQVKLGLIKAQLESLGDDLSLDLDLDGDLGDTLDDLSDTMEDISESFNADLNESIDRLEDIEFDFGNAPVKGGGDSGGDTGSDSGDKSALEWAREFSRNFNGGDNDFRTYDSVVDSARLREMRLSEMGPNFSDTKLDDFQLLGGNEELLRSIQTLGVSEEERFGGESLEKWMRQSKFMGGEGNLHRSGSYRSPGVSNLGELPEFGYDLENGRGAKGFKSTLKSSFDGDVDLGKRGKMKKGILGLSRGLDKVTDAAKSAIPRMSTWFNLLAAAIPALAAVVVQALGVAAAFGAIAVAGAAMIGIGLLGHGDSMAESFRNAGEEVDQLKKDLFETFQPSAQFFSGVQAEFFDFMPGELDRVSESMRELLPLKGEFFEMFTQITKFVAQFFTMLGANSSTISELFDSFKGVIGNGIINFFEWLMKTAERNQPMLKELGSVFQVVALALYEIFLVVSKAITKLTPLWILLAGIASLMNNEFVANMLAGIAVLYIFTNILPALYLSLQAVGFALQRNMIPAIAKASVAIAGYITQGLMAIGVSGAWAASIAAVTTALMGLLAVSAVGLALPVIGGALMGSVGSGIPGAGGSAPTDFSGGGSSNGTTNNYYEGDNVNVDLSGGDTASYEKFADMQSGRDRGAVDGSYTG